MRAGSFGLPPRDGEAIHQRVDDLLCIALRSGCQMGVLCGRQDRVMAEDLLHLEQIDARLDQMSCIAVAKTMGGDLFLPLQQNLWVPSGSGRAPSA